MLTAITMMLSGMNTLNPTREVMTKVSWKTASNPIIPPMIQKKGRLQQKFGQDTRLFGADGLFQPDLAGSFPHGHEHDILATPNIPDQQR